MTDPRIFAVTGYEQVALPFLSRIYKNVPGIGRSIVQPADISSIVLTIRRFNTVDGGWGNITMPINAMAVTVGTSVFDTLQVDSSWNQDAIGYNFAHTIPSNAFPGLGEYVGLYEFTPTGSNFSIFPLVLKIKILSLQGVFAEE